MLRWECARPARYFVLLSHFVFLIASPPHPNRGHKDGDEMDRSVFHARHSTPAFAEALLPNPDCDRDDALPRAPERRRESATVWRDDRARGFCRGSKACALMR